MYRTLHKQRKERAADLFCDIKKNITRLGLNCEEYFYILPHGHFGEYTYTLGHLPSLRKNNKVCLIVPEKMEWLTKYFPTSYDFVIPIPDASLDLYEDLFEISYLSPGHPYVVWTDIIANGRFNSELLRYGRITLSESYAFALEQPLESALTPLNYEHLNKETKREGMIRALFTKQKKQTLIMPNAITIKALPQTYWIDLYNFLNEIGRNPIIDSTFVDWDVSNFSNIHLVKDELINFAVEKVAAIVGLRSGMLDLLSGLTKQIDIKVAALYPIDTEHFQHSEPGHTVRGFSKGGINLSKCWNSSNISDIEVDSIFDKTREGEELKDFLGKTS